MKRIMVAGAHSGSGKTTIMCALLKAFMDRGRSVCGFKCGPDYIDPLFHSKVIGAGTTNLDSCFMDSNGMRWQLCQAEGDIALIEGVMGFYDGVGEKGSSYQVSMQTQTPVIIVLDCKGMSLSIGAMMYGFLHFRTPNRIAGFIFNRLPKSQVPLARQLCSEMKTGYLGYFPYDADVQIASRHLGLVTVQEIADLQQKISRLSVLAQRYIDLDAIEELAATACELSASPPDIAGVCKQLCYEIPVKRMRVAVARDEAFCFYYEDNLRLLSELGIDLIPFSPLKDKSLPEHICGLLLGGGYPELYAGQLTANVSMLSDVKCAVRNKMPTIAECGGFMYLHSRLETADGQMVPMAGVFPQSVRRKDRLVRFGYVDLYAQADTMLAAKGECLAAHEFHYWDSEHNGSAYRAVKRSNGMSYEACIADKTLYAGFPHLYFGANPKAAVRFAKACRQYDVAGT